MYICIRLNTYTHIKLIRWTYILFLTVKDEGVEIDILEPRKLAFYSLYSH